MMHLKQIFRPVLLALAFFVLCTGCKPYLAVYDQLAYAQTTAAKVDVLNLMDKSGEPYNQHQAQVDHVTANVMKIIEYEKHRPGNGITVSMWNKMLDSTGQDGIIGRYLASWKTNGTKRPAMIQESKQQVSRGFDLIAELESRKIKESNSGVLNFLK